MLLNLFKAQLVVFDFDGILIKRMPNQFPSSLFKEFAKNSDIFSENSIIRLKGTNWIEELEKMGVDTGDKKILAAISLKLLEHYKGQLNLYDWVPKLIPVLAKNKKLAILTNNSLLTVVRCLNGLENHFSIIKTWENVPKLKPAPDGLLSICQELKIAPSETLMVGDSEEDLTAANKAGTTSIIVSGGDYFNRIQFTENNPPAIAYPKGILKFCKKSA